MEERQVMQVEIDDVDLFELTVTDVGEEAAAFARVFEGGGCICSCGCFGGATNCN